MSIKKDNVTLMFQTNIFNIYYNLTDGMCMSDVYK